jgi:hypothetical protein
MEVEEDKSTKNTAGNENFRKRILDSVKLVKNLKLLFA